jgi:HTH-type transcriptional regulator/antitoxin HigA
MSNLVLNETTAREARVLVTELDQALSSARAMEAIVAGLPEEVIEGVRRALKTERKELAAQIEAYDKASKGDFQALWANVENDPGLALIVARITRGMTQKELARKLGLKEQQVQRYETERYRAISLANFKKIAAVLGVRWQVNPANWHDIGWRYASTLTPEQLRKVLRHARAHNWFKSEPDDSEEESFESLRQYVAEHVVQHGAPSLLRTGMAVLDQSDDWLLLAWKARVTGIARSIVSRLGRKAFQPTSVSWLPELVRLSEREDGPLLAKEMLLQRGIVLIVEHHITGMKIDGAAFLVDDVPVIGLTLRRDSLDNFWFTLLHEVGHVILHHRTGLKAGFFDDLDARDIDSLEAEANSFAANMLIPEQVWAGAPARISTSASVIENFAKRRQIHPAIVFGRIRMERGYDKFSNKIGQGLVRPWFFKEQRDKT